MLNKFIGNNNQLDNFEEWVTSPWIEYNKDIKNIQFVLHSSKDKNHFKTQIFYLFENQARKIPGTVPKVNPSDEGGDKRKYFYKIPMSTLVSGTNTKHFKILIKFMIEKSDYIISLTSLNLGDACYSSVPCQNGGKCINTGPSSYSCDCSNLLDNLKKGGQNCDQDLCTYEVSSYS